MAKRSFLPKRTDNSFPIVCSHQRHVAFQFISICGLEKKLDGVLRCQNKLTVPASMLTEPLLQKEATAPVFESLKLLMDNYRQKTSLEG